MDILSQLERTNQKTIKTPKWMALQRFIHKYPYFVRVAGILSSCLYLSTITIIFRVFLCFFCFNCVCQFVLFRCLWNNKKKKIIEMQMAAWSVFSVPLSRRRVVVVGMRNVQNKTNKKCYHNVEEQYLASNLARSFALCVSLWADEHGLATAAVDRRCRRMLLDCRRRRCRCCLCPQL